MIIKNDDGVALLEFMTVLGEVVVKTVGFRIFSLRDRHVNGLNWVEVGRGGCQTSNTAVLLFAGPLFT